MYCEECGASIVDDAVFCSYCGVKISEEGKTPTHVQTDSSNDDETASGSDSDQTEAKHERPIFMPAPAPKRLSGKTIAAICVVLVAVIAIIVGSIMLNADQQEKAYHAAHPVKIKVDARDYSDGDTLIPAQVTGTSLDDEEIKEIFFINAEGTGIELKKGSYVLYFPASPLTEDGILYDMPDEAFELILSDELEPESTQDLSNKIILTMVKSTALDENDEMIQDAYGYAIQDPAQEEKADALKKVAEQVHSEAVAEEESRLAEEARLAEEKAKRQAMKKALKANPKTIGLSSTPNLTKKAKLTGTVVYKKVSVPNSTKKQYVCYLKLPKKVSIPGTVYGEISSSKIILPAKSFKKYKGQTITISAQYEIDTTTTIAAASVSKIHAYKAKLSKAWDL